MAAEFLKAWTLRSQKLLWTAGFIGALVGTGTALLFARILGSIDADLPMGEISALVARAPVAGAATAALIWGFAAIHLSAAERGGRETLTDLETPARGRTFVARLVVASSSSLVCGVAVVVAGGAVTAAYGSAVGEPVQADGAAWGAWAAVALAMSLCVTLAACLGLAVPHGVAAAGLWAALLVVVPGVLGSLAATSQQSAYAWAAAGMPAGRLGAVVDASSPVDVAAIAAAVGALFVWATIAIAGAGVVWRSKRRSGRSPRR